MDHYISEVVYFNFFQFLKFVSFCKHFAELSTQKYAGPSLTGMY